MLVIFGGINMYKLNEKKEIGLLISLNKEKK